MQQNSHYAVPPSDGKTRPFTSSKYDRAQNAETLDRRKVDKLGSPPGTGQDSGSGSSQQSVTLGRDGRAKTGSKQSSQEQGSAGGHKRQESEPDKMLFDRGRVRPRNPWRLSFFTLLATAIGLTLLGVIVDSFLTKQRDAKGYRMSYSRPAFAKLTGFDAEHTRFSSKYSLYLYREGGIDEDLRVKGVPVIFIPGNAGSYKQARTLASDAAVWFAQYVQHQPEMVKAGVRTLDFFTADFNEEFSAFHGQTVLDQAEYLNDAIAYILSMYHDPKRSRRDSSFPDPTSVIIVGHSMGGIVARNMLLMPNYQSNSINTILTIATPHARAPVTFDSGIVEMYLKINDYWRESYSKEWASDNPLWHVTLVSVAGGGLDTTVPSDYASLSSLVPETHGFTVFTAGIPDVWTGTDHLSILWGDQLGHILPRALTELTDVTRPDQTKPRPERIRIFKKWLLSGLEDDTEKFSFQKGPTTLLRLADIAESTLNSGERLTIRRLGSDGKPKARLIPIPRSHITSKFTLLTDQPLDGTGAQGTLEVLLCSVYHLGSGRTEHVFSSKIDLLGSDSTAVPTHLACQNAASDNIKLPASTGSSRFSFDPIRPFSYLQFDVDALSDYQFVAVVDKGQARDSGWVVAEFSEAEHSITHSDVNLSMLLSTGLRLTLPAGRPMLTEVRIPEIHSSLLTYKLRVSSSSCGDSTPLFMPLLRQSLSSPYESKFFPNIKEADINIHGITPFLPPALHDRHATEGISLQVWSDPTCNSSLEMSLKLDIIGSLGKLVMRYRTVIPAIPLVVISLVLRKQFMIYDKTGVFMPFSEALDRTLRRSFPALLASMTCFSFSLATSSAHPAGSTASGIFPWNLNYNATVDYAKNDLLLGSQDPFFWFLVPLFGLVSVAMCVVVNYVALVLVHTCCFAWKGFTSLKAKARGESLRRNLGPAFSQASPRQRLAIICVPLFFVSTIIPYQFIYVIACIAQLVTCTRALRVAMDTVSSPHYNLFNYTHSILVLMLWVLPINIPVLVVWIHNLAVQWLTPFSSHHNVLSILPFVLHVEILAGGKIIPRLAENRARHVTNVLFFTLAVYASVYGVSFAYQLYLLAGVICAWIVGVHLLASGHSGGGGNGPGVEREIDGWRKWVAGELKGEGPKKRP